MQKRKVRQLYRLWFGAGLSTHIGTQSKIPLEAPAEFHLGSMLVSMGSVIGRRAYLLSPTPIYPNLYVCLVGSTSDDRKSTAADLALDFDCRVAAEICASGSFAVLRGVASVEGLAHQMAPRDELGKITNNGRARIIVDTERELHSLISKSRQSAVENIPAKLTELYDCPATFEVNTRTNAICLEEPFLSILAGTTPVWLGQCVTPVGAASGQFNRWQFFIGNSDRDIPNPKSPQFSELIGKVAERLKFSIRELPVNSRSGGYFR